jgi:hypothetical protein
MPVTRAKVSAYCSSSGSRGAGAPGAGFEAVMVRSAPLCLGWDGVEAVTGRQAKAVDDVPC